MNNRPAGDPRVSVRREVAVMRGRRAAGVSVQSPRWNRSTDMTGDDEKKESTRWGTDAGPAGNGTVPTTSGERGGSDPLGHVRRVETIADRTDFEAIRSELPDGWEIRPEIVQFGAAPLAETVVIEEKYVGPKLLLKPVDDTRPTGEIELYERGGPRATRRVTMTVDSLSAALRAAVNRAHQLFRE